MPFVIVIRIYPTLKHKIQFLAMQCFITAFIIIHKDVLVKVYFFTIEYALIFCILTLYCTNDYSNQTFKIANFSYNSSDIKHHSWNFLSFIFKKNEIYRKGKSNANAFYCLLLLLRRRRENDISPSLCKIAWSEDWWYHIPGMIITKTELSFEIIQDSYKSLFICVSF